MADCGVRWRLGEVPVYVAPKNSTLDHHVLKMKDATDAMFAFGQRHGVRYLFQSPAEALVQDADGRIVGVVVREGYGEEKYIHAELLKPDTSAFTPSPMRKHSPVSPAVR